MEHEQRLTPDNFSTDSKSGANDGFVAADIVGSNDVPTEDRLDALGVEASAIPEVIELIEAEAKREAWHLTALVLKWVGERLANHSTHSAAVAVALGIHGGSLADIAAGHGVTKQALSVCAMRLRDTFAAKATGTEGQPSGLPIERPKEPGIWMTPAEARKAVGGHPFFYRKIGVQSAFCNRRIFFERSSLVERMKERRAMPNSSLPEHVQYA